MGDKGTVNRLGFSSQSRAIARRLTDAERSVASVKSIVHCEVGRVSALRTDLNREVGARRVRFGSTWRNHSELAYRFNRLEEDYLNLRDDFDLMLHAVRDIVEGGSTTAKRRGLQDLTLIRNRRSRHHQSLDYLPSDVPPPRPPSPYAVIEAEHNEELSGAGNNVQG